MDTPKDFLTPIPGERICDADSRKFIVRLNNAFRPQNPKLIPSNLPLPCLLNGKKDKSFLNSADFLRRAKVYCWVDGTDFVHLVQPSEVSRYVEDREPWEDYDLCIFDETFE